MNFPRWFLTLAPALVLSLGLGACAPEGGGQTGSEILCATDEDCVNSLGEGYTCGDVGECILDITAEETSDSCPTTCDDWCPLTATCEVPDGCENPGCRCADGDCAVDPVCPTTCDDWCPLTAACEVPDGCENPGCRCVDGDCAVDPVCPTTCDDWCPMAGDCTVPDGCENPGCGCPTAVCE
jgi:hypothetical protein